MAWLGKDSCRSTAQNKNKNSTTDQRSYISHLSLKILTINATFDFKFFSFCKQTAVLFHFRTPAFVYLFLGTFFANPRFMSSPNLFHFRTPSSLGCWRALARLSNLRRQQCFEYFQGNARLASFPSSIWWFCSVIGKKLNLFVYITLNWTFWFWPVGPGQPKRYEKSAHA